MSRSAPTAVLAAIACCCLCRIASGCSGDEMLRISNAPGGAPGNSNSYYPSISRDGRVIAFESTASDLVAGDTNGVADIFVFDRPSGVLERVSVATDGTQADGECGLPILSGEGRYVVFDSSATNLDAGDNGSALLDLFVRDRVAGTTRRISSTASGAPANGNSNNAQMTPDARFVVYQSSASDLVAGDTNGRYDIFRSDLVAGTTVRVSTDSAEIEGNGDSVRPFISDEGSVIAFNSRSTNFPHASYDSTFATNAFRKSLVSGVLERVDVDWTGAYPYTNSGVSGISADGGIVCFGGTAAYVVEDTNGAGDGYLRDFVAGSLERVTVKSGGDQLQNSSTIAITPDARHVLFLAYEDDVVPGDDNGLPDYFIHDRWTEVTSVVTVGTFDEPNNEANTGSGWMPLSGDGKHVVIHSHATSFVSGDDNRAEDVFLRNRCDVEASSVNYGEGLRGLLGVPALTLSAPPWRGSTAEIRIGNSAGIATLAYVILGTDRADVPTSLGGHLLVQPLAASICPVDIGGGACAALVPNSWQFCGAIFDLQALELDPAAANGVSFTRGLELTVGD